MSNVKISALPVGVATSSTPFPAVVGGVTDQVTLAPLYTAIAAVLDTIGHCRPQVDSTTSLSLQRYQGSTLPIKTGSTWAAMTIPASGPSLGTSGLSADTVYRIYAFNNSGTLTLEASTTAHATDADTGVEIKSGDATRTLVGMVRTNASTQFVNSVTNRWLISWFNRSGLDMVNTYSADRSSTSTSFAELNSEIRLQFLTWADESVFVCAEGSAQTDSSGQATLNGVDFDSTTTAAQAVSAIMTATQAQPYAVSIMKRLSEGAHIAHHNVAVSGGTASWTTADSIATGKAKTRLWGFIRG